MAGLREFDVPERIKSTVFLPRENTGLQRRTILNAKRSSICKSLENLPFEVLHQVLDDIPVATILDISCKLSAPDISRDSESILSEESRFDQCLLCHIRYEYCFETAIALHRVRCIWSIYQKLWERTHRMRPDAHGCLCHVSLGKLSVSPSTSVRLPTSEEIWDIAHRGLAELLLTPGVSAKIAALGSRENKVLLNHALPAMWVKWYNRNDHLPRPKRPKDVLTSTDWDKLYKAERDFIKMRSDQMYRLADLLESNPRMIKIATDPSQKPRKNIRHCVVEIRHRAKKALNARYLATNGKGSAYLRYVQFALVPFDKDINTLLHAIRSESYIRVTHDLSEDSEHGSPDADTSNENAVKHKQRHLEDLTCMLAGLNCYYTKAFFGNATTRVPRIGQTEIGKDSRKEVFFLWPPAPHFRKNQNQEKQSQEGSDQLALPCADEEFEWLEAYLRTCKFLQSHGLWIEESASV